MERNYPHVLMAFYGEPWAIRLAKFNEIQTVLLHRIKAGAEFPAAFEDAYTARPASGPGYMTVGAAAVVSVLGTITPRPSMFTDFSGGTAADAVGKAVEAAANDGKIERIVLHVDSPGGSVAGMPENMTKIMAARKIKPVTAVAEHEAASGGYFFASQANSIAVTSAGWVGSVGVIWPRTDETKLEESLGVKTHVTTATGSPFKGEGRPDLPMTDSEAANRQKIVDDLFAQFVGLAAKGRGVKPSVIERDYGGGRMLSAQDALAAGMVDRIATLEEIIGEVNGVKTARMKRKVAASLASHGLPTAGVA